MERLKNLWTFLTTSKEVELRWINLYWIVLILCMVFLIPVLIFTNEFLVTIFFAVWIFVWATYRSPKVIERKRRLLKAKKTETGLTEKMEESPPPPESW